MIPASPLHSRFLFFPFSPLLLLLRPQTGERGTIRGFAGCAGKKKLKEREREGGGRDAIKSGETMSSLTERAGLNLFYEKNQNVLLNKNVNSNPTQKHPQNIFTSTFSCFPTRPLQDPADTLGTNRPATSVAIRALLPTHPCTARKQQTISFPLQYVFGLIISLIINICIHHALHHQCAMISVYVHQ